MAGEERHWAKEKPRPRPMPSTSGWETKAMDVTIERQDGVLSVRVGGRIDGSNAHEFEKAIKTTNCGQRSRRAAFWRTRELCERH